MDALIQLGPNQYQQSLNAYRNQLEMAGGDFLWVGVETPRGAVVEIKVRRSNAYLVAFKGKSAWYRFDEEQDVLGEPCGFNSNYNDLGKVGNVVYDDLNALSEIAEFKKGVSAANTRLIAILIALTSEAARFATVAAYFTGLTNAVGTEHSHHLMGIKVDFEHLKTRYFTQWEKSGDVPGVLLAKRSK